MDDYDKIRICWNGSALFGNKQHYKMIYLTLGIIISKSLYFDIYYCYLYHIYSSIYYVLYALIFQIATLLFYILCFTTDPGIIRKYQLDEKQIKELQEQDQNATQPQPQQPRILTTRFCETCKIMRPPKASHCKDCDACVLEFDHHCFWIANCVGLRNRKWFVLFLNFALLATTTHFTYALVILSYQYQMFTNTFQYWYQLNTMFWISIVIIIVSIYLSMVSRNAYFYVFGNFIGISYLFILFIYCQQKSNNVQFLQGPFLNVLTIIITFLFIPTLLPIAAGNCYFIAAGVTMKSSTQLKGSCGIRNCIYFWCRDTPTSEILK